MSTTNLRKVGGSVMMAVPRAALDQMHLEAGSQVNIEIAQGQLVVKPAQPEFTLDELLAQCDFEAPFSEDERAWMDSPAVGKEQI